MPEGHTLHRLALQFRREMGGQRLRVTSPQGRFAAGAALLDGTTLVRTDAHGKHLFLGFADDSTPGTARSSRPPQRWLRVHLGLYGVWTFVPLDGVVPEPRGAVRARLVGTSSFADLRGPIACEVVSPAEKAAVHAALGPDPLRRGADGAAFVDRVTGSRAPIGVLLMDQSVLSGVGNVYRAEVLFRAGLSPFTPGRDVPTEVAHTLWQDLRGLLRDGVRRGRIVTVDAAERPRRRVGPDDAFYVYRRAGQPCRRCGTPVARREVATRNLFWCPTCQP